MRVVALLVLFAALLLALGGCVQVSTPRDPWDPQDGPGSPREAYDVSPLDVLDAFGS